MRLVTVLMHAVCCEGVTYPAGTSIDDIPERNRESVRGRYCEDVRVDDAPPSPKAAPAPKASGPTQPSRSRRPAAAPKVEEPKVPEQPKAEEPSADDESASTSTPLPPIAEDLTALLVAGGLETIEAVHEYFQRNKSFRPLKGVTEAKDQELRTALGL